MKTLQLMFSFMLLGYSSTEEYKANITNCPDAKYKIGLYPGAHVKAACLEPQDHSTCLIPFDNHWESVELNFDAPEGVKNRADICTHGSLYTKPYGELVKSSKVKSISVRDGPGSSRKNKGKVVKGQNVVMETDYKIHFRDNTSISNILGDFIIKVIPNCKEDVEAWFCVKIPVCIWGKYIGYGQCYQHLFNN